MRLKFYSIVFILLIFSLVLIDGKRSRGRSRGSSGSSSSSFWSRKSKGSSSSKSEKATQTAVSPLKPLKPIEKPKVAEKPKPSAPVQETPIKKENTNLQQNTPNSERPIGWNVDGQKQHVNPVQNSNPGNYPNSAGYPGYSNTGNYPHASYPNANPGNYPHASYPNANPSYPGNYPNANPGYPGNYPHASYPNANPGYPNAGNVGNYPNYGHSQYPQQSYPGHYGGGSWFGGNKPGFGGYGGYGALAGYGMQKKSGGLLGKHPVRNILGGLFVWYLISGLTSRPYHVYNYYNQPAEERAEIKLPANLLTLCDENVTSLCVPGTYALCTTNNSILCVVSMTSTVPCEDDHKENCVTSKIKCDDMNDTICQNTTTSDNTTSVNLPCFTNMTLDTTQRNGSSDVQIPFSEDHRYCVTALAVPDNTPMNSTEIQPIVGNFSEFSTVSTTTSHTNISSAIEEKSS